MLSLLFSLITAQAETIGSITPALSYNRLGASVVVQHGVHIPKWEQEGKVLFQGTGIQAVGELNMSPAFVKPGVRVTLIPLAMLKLQGYVFGEYYFGNFQTIIGYDDLSVNYGSNSDISSYTENTGRQYSGGGWHGGGKMVLQAKVKNVVFLNSADYGYSYVMTPEGETGAGMLDRANEIMIAFEGEQMLDNNTMLFYQLDKESEKFYRFGLLNTYRRSFKADDVLLRTGFLGMAKTSEKGMHILIVQPYLIDRAFGENWTTPYIAYAFKYAY